MRPIVHDVGIKSLAKSESVLCTYYLEIEKRKNLISRIKDKLGTIQSLKAAEFEISFEKEPKISDAKTPDTRKVHVHETHVNAWIKNYNSYFSLTGLYRIWDYPPVNLTENMIAELITIAENISSRLSKASRTFWMPQIKAQAAQTQNR